jgi:nitrate/TMAO reductase-like tetraheme cytochrome c subunit
VEPLAPHERVFVDSDFANDENHGKLGCEECHGGDPADPNWKTAHQGMRKDPSFPDPSQTCGQCHEEIAESAKHSLHMTLSPFHKITDLRASPDKSKKTKVDHARKTHCSKCHSAAQMHADGRNYANRYDVEYAPDCVDCHQNIYEKTENHSKTHNEHRGKVSCHVCYSMPYKNCFGCHFGKDDKGKNYYQTDMSKIDFKIGLNPLQSQSRPEKFVILRHIPIDQDSYKYYVEDGLNRFDNLPTWKFATPHTIRRKTPQNKSCNSCHGNSRLFLNQKDVKPKYLKANQSVIVPTELIPVKIDD